MNRFERGEVERLPEKYRPMGAWGYFGYEILFAIPLIGFIVCIVFALDNGYIARRNFARSRLIVEVIMLILIIVAVVIVLTLYPNIFEYFSSVK